MEDRPRHRCAQSVLFLYAQTQRHLGLLPDLLSTTSRVHLLQPPPEGKVHASGDTQKKANYRLETLAQFYTDEFRRQFSAGGNG